MGSRASTQAALPGLPQQTELAYLAGLLDRSGGIVRDPAGLKLVVSEKLRSWLLVRFGGFETAAGAWWLTQQATLLYLLPQVRRYAVPRGPQLEALEALVAHSANRERYHGDDEWRQRRDQLREAVQVTAYLA